MGACALIYGSVCLQARYRERERLRLIEAARKTEVLKLLAQLPKPLVQECTDDSITLTMDRNSRFDQGVRTASLLSKPGLLGFESLD